MGRPIVYCGICGKSLREEEFSKGRAHVVDNASYCTGCRIVPEPLAAAATKSPPTPPPIVPKPSGASSKSLPSATPRRAHAPVPEESSSLGLVIGIGVVVLAIIVLAVILMSSGGPPAPPPAMPTTNAPPPRAPDPPRPPGPRPSPPEDDGQAAIRTLEAFASSSTDPQAVLDRCEELKPKLRGTPQLSRLEAVEARAIEARNLRSREQKLTMSLENVKNLREFDKEFKKREEVESLLKAAMDISGPRKAEVEKLLAEYQKAAADFAAKPRTPAPLPSPSPAPTPGGRLGPYDLDEGGMVRHWLVLGPYGNRKDRSGFQDHDLLKTEVDHVPVLGQEFTTREGTKVRWQQAGPAGDRVVFRSMEALGLGSKPAAPAIVFVACWLSVEKESHVRFRMLVDDGYLMWLDHKRILKQSGQGWGSPEMAQEVTLSPGPHLLVLKVGSVGGEDFGFRLRITTLAGEPVPGVRVWNQEPVMPRVLYAEHFNQGRGSWVGGEVVPGGVEGTTALSVPKGKSGVYLEKRILEKAGPSWTLRFKVKPSVDLKYFELLIWAGRDHSNFRYHLRNLNKDQWNQVEMKAAELNIDWNGKGATFEGEAVHGLRLYMDDAMPDGSSVLIDDFEILE
ncbi:MAG TPA: hypothetical protein VNM14_25475 [Planctomycetota bacterium]|jgi:hypothetical protein|nr:hypothetical protein [Planctomycetota bacterium]